MVVTGMSCANCARRVERKVAALEGVEAVHVDLVQERLTFRFDPALTGEHAVLAQVEAMGYGIARGEVSLALAGLRDGTDAARLERRLAAQDGVLEARVGLGTEEARVTFLSGRTGVADLVALVRQEGFDLARDPEAPVEAGRAPDRERPMMILGLLLALPLVVLGMAPRLCSPWLLLVPATLVQFGVGATFYAGACRSLRSGSANMDVLVALGSSAAYLASLAALLGLGTHVTFETGAAIIAFVRLGRFLEARARRRATSLVEALAALRPPTARVVREGAETDVDVASVVPGDRVRVRPGERVPVDGLIASGRTSFDESLVTGESMPRSRGPGDPVLGGTLNLEGLVALEATRTGRDTTLERIVAMVREAQGSRAPIERLADRVSRVFVPAILLVALAAFLLWAAQGAWPRALTSAVAVLVVACPCALGLATPTAIVVGSARGAEGGLLFRNGEVLQGAGQVDLVVLDKTGTLTLGEPRVTDLVALEGPEEELLRLAASAEQGSEHPLGRAVVRAALDRGLALEPPEAFTSHAGLGVRARVGGTPVLLGAPRLLVNEGLDLAGLEEAGRRLQGEGRTVVLLAAGDPLRPRGLLALEDTLRPEAPGALAALRALGLDLAMITGDNLPSAQGLARTLGIDRVLADVLPGGKAEAIRDLQHSGLKVAMVGDGLNDAPALAQADVGIALGTGTDLAKAAAGITLVGSDLGGVPRAVELSRRTLRTIRQNLAWAFLYNLALVPAAALGLLDPMLAALAMSFSSVFVVANSLRLRRARPGKRPAPGGHRRW
jgi:Cu+-exporting ATPase